MAERTYLLGLPVAITVSDDGGVTFDPDLGEINLWEGEQVPTYPNDVVQQDAARVVEAFERDRIRPRKTPAVGATYGFTAANGVPFVARIETFTAVDPRLTVCFFDTRHIGRPNQPGQFVSDYFVETILAGADGLLLHGAYPDEWAVDATSMYRLRAWLRQVTA
jgi:hypothetical protein